MKKFDDRRLTDTEFEELEDMVKVAYRRGFGIGVPTDDVFDMDHIEVIEFLMRKYFTVRESYRPMIMGILTKLHKTL